MQISPLALVTGANGHLGNNIVRELLRQHIPVRAGVRNLRNHAPFAGLNCERVALDILNPKQLQAAMRGVDTVYAVAAAFKFWAKNPQKEIYDVNMAGTWLLLEAAAAAGVRRVVYVSSTAALNYSCLPTTEACGYNTDRRNVYYNSKNDSDEMAMQLAASLGLELVSILPATMIGGENFALNESYQILANIYQGKMPIDPNIYLNWVDVKDVAQAAVAASSRGRAGERYVLAQEKGTSMRETLELLNRLFPEQHLKVPPRPPRPLLRGIAWFMETSSRLAGKAPLLQTSLVDMLWGLRRDYDISKARYELGFAPRCVEQSVREAILYLRQHPALLAAG
ncbi:NAD-dependent epimerase/dehydratase family protein [Hymenobacter terrenus]|uniref:NAD-dependent epimerase/dehydratase family protein n=1 Tax=Hymenobacter terrenus TaxID=1629124 RepID=UPI000619A508|nr:NAD-dependent epimerase/dehydratase family protein [Hymenobacter terrenus]